ncbi:MAG: PAS domain-containing protein [Pirellulaceae bacterium]|nr:PAS domain-containing protein [Pirellulaceae bacterium]
MSGVKGCNLLAAAALVLSVGLACAMLAGLVTDQSGWFVRWAAFVAGLILASVAAFALAWPSSRTMRTARLYLEQLGRIAPSEMSAETVGNKVIPLPSDHPLRGAADRLCDLLIGACEQVHELEHARNAAEIRCHRAIDERDRIRSVLAGLDEPIVAIDQFDEIMLANPSAEALLDFDSESAENRALDQLVRCENLINVLTSTCHRRNAARCSDEIEITDQSGRGCWYRVTARKLTARSGNSSGAEGESIGAVAVLRDIGETKVLQRRNAEFVSSVSHEMKTPLAGIKAYVELLADGEAEDQATREEFLGVIGAQADRLQRLVENLLNLARMEAGVVKVDKKPRPLNEILEEALNVVRPAAEAKQIALVSDLSKMYLGLLADRDMLLQAAINLLSNAIKYTPEGGQVTLRSRVFDTDVRFEVEDTGVGLSEEDTRRVFEKFYRVKKDKNMASGTGLGLPLAKHIVEDVHGGTLTVHSTLGKGSTFAVTIPGTGQMS